jgi:hypothetical protein
VRLCSVIATPYYVADSMKDWIAVAAAPRPLLEGRRTRHHVALPGDAQGGHGERVPDPLGEKVVRGRRLARDDDPIRAEEAEHGTDGLADPCVDLADSG